jgi:hypothetical protein
MSTVIAYIAIHLYLMLFLMQVQLEKNRFDHVKFAEKTLNQGTGLISVLL